MVMGAPVANVVLGRCKITDADVLVVSRLAELGTLPSASGDGGGVAGGVAGSVRRAGDVSQPRLAPVAGVAGGEGGAALGPWPTGLLGMITRCAAKSI